MWSNFHTHTHYCDGKGVVTDYLEACRRSGVGQIGFSSHAPLPFPCKWCMQKDAFPKYLHEIRLARNSYPDLEVYCGLEIDFIPGIIAPSDFASSLDYTIGSIHFVGGFEGRHWEIDNTSEVFNEGLSKAFSNDIRTAVSAYYDLTRQMLRISPPTVLGHLDKIKVNAHNHFSENETWYVNEVEKTLKAIAETQTIIEVNTRGLYKRKSATTYPGPEILERILALGIPITLNSDAHHPADLTREFDSTLALLRNIGFKDVQVLTKGAWTTTPLSDYGSHD